MVGVSYQISGGSRALAVLTGIVERAQNPRGLYDNIGASLVASTNRRFETGTAPGGSKWPASIRARMSGGKTLLDTGRLAGSITHNATDSRVEVGTNVIYAAVHQLGAVITPVKAAALRFKIGKAWISTKQVVIPARPFLGVDDDDEREIILIGEDWLRGEAGAA